MSDTIRIVSTVEDEAPAPVGYVEATTENTVLGWVWRPGRAERLRVDLQLDGRAIASTVADTLRDDLARGGIGDGRHAFTLPIPVDFVSRRAELRVVTDPGDGPPVTLLAPPAGPALDQLGQLQRGIEMLVGSQRLLHRNLQTALLQQGPSPTQLLAEIAATQSKLQDAIATTELFAIRLEQTFTLQKPTASPAKISRLALAAITISSVAFVVALAALSQTVLGG